MDNWLTLVLLLYGVLLFLGSVSYLVKRYDRQTHERRLAEAAKRQPVNPRYVMIMEAPRPFPPPPTVQKPMTAGKIIPLIKKPYYSRSNKPKK